MFVSGAALQDSTMILDMTQGTTGRDFFTGPGGSHSLKKLTDKDGTEVTYTLINLIADSEVRIYKTSDFTALSGAESSSTTFSYPYVHISDIDITIIVFHLDYVDERFTDTLTADSKTVSIRQRTDRVFDNS